MDKYPLTIRLDDELMKVVKVQATLTRSSLGSVVVDAARQGADARIPAEAGASVAASDESLLQSTGENARGPADTAMSWFARCWRCSCAHSLRHTPAVKPQLRDAATASAARRFEVFLDALATNRRNRRSVMDPTPEAGSGSIATRAGAQPCAR